MKECCSRYLREQFGDDDDVVGEIYAEYVSSVREKTAEAKPLLEAGDWTRLDRVAHTVKGNALAAGDAETADVALELRKAAALTDRELAASLIARIEELASQL